MFVLNKLTRKEKVVAKSYLFFILQHIR